MRNVEYRGPTKQLIIRSIGMDTLIFHSSLAVICLLGHVLVFQIDCCCQEVREGSRGLKLGLHFPSGDFVVVVAVRLGR